MFDAGIFRWLGYVVLGGLVMPLFPFTYVVLRWRDENARGTYAAVLYFLTASVLLALAGASNLTYGWISSTPIDIALHRLSWGMFIGSLVFFAINAFLLTRLGAQPDQRDARRVFGGFLMLMAGLVAFAVLVMFFITAFEQVDEDNASAVLRKSENLKLYGAWTFYYLLTYLSSVALLRKTRDGR